jgi:acetyltransferase-like isoleucine patch superfamily enzyme
MNPVAARIFGLGQRLGSAARILLARASGVEVGSNCLFGRGCDLAGGIAEARRGRIRIGARCTVENNVVLRAYGGSIDIADDVFLGPGTVIYGHGGVTIGTDTLISMHTRILSSNHTIPGPETAIRALPDVRQPTHIGCDVWIGAGATILGGVTIGDGCVVGAGSVVTRDLPPHSVAVGIPAQVKRRR